MEEIAREEEGKGRKVWVRYGKIRIDEKWWRWDEEGEVLRDGRGNKMGEGQGEGRRGKVEERRDGEEKGGRGRGEGMENRILKYSGVKK